MTKQPNGPIAFEALDSKDIAAHLTILSFEMFRKIEVFTPSPLLPLFFRNYLIGLMVDFSLLEDVRIL